MKTKKKEAVEAHHKQKITQLPNGWYSTHIYSNKKRRTIACKTENELFDVLYTHYTDELIRERVIRYSIHDIYEEWVSDRMNKVTGSTRRRDADFYRSYIKDSPLAQKAIPTITIRDVEAWIDDVLGSPENPKLTRKAYNSAFGILSSLLRYYAITYPMSGFCGTASILGDIRVGRTRFQRVKKKTSEAVIFTANEVELIVDTCEKMAKVKKNPLYLAIPIALYSGTRPEELMALRFDDFSNETLHIHQRLTAIDVPNSKNASGYSRHWEIVDALKQNGQDRYIHISPRINEWVSEVKSISNSEQALLFQVMTLKPIETVLAKVCEQIGIDHKPPKALRKTYASYYYSACLDMDRVARQLGHSNTITASQHYVYTIHMQGQDEEAVKRYQDAILL